jgi:hypothetical protein
VAWALRAAEQTAPASAITCAPVPAGESTWRNLFRGSLRYGCCCC